MKRLSAAAAGSSFAMALLIAVVVAAVAVIAYARIPARDGAITACVHRTTGAVRFVDSSSRRQRCRRTERVVRFNQRGPMGPQGPSGPRGGAGAGGAPGAGGSPGRDAGTVVEGGTCSDIQAAIDGLPAGGGAVLVRPGVYTCDASIVIDRDDVSLRGSGPATVLKLGDHVNRPVIVLGQTAGTPTTMRRNLRVSDLSIDGNRAHQEFECSVSDCVGDDHLRNNGLSLRHVEDVAVEDVTVKSARSGGLVVEKGSRRVTVRDFTTFDNAFDGIAGYQTEDSLFTGLKLHDNMAAGLSFDLAFDHNTITNSVLAGNGDVGLFMRDARENAFSDLHIRDSFKDGVYLAANDVTSGPALGNTFVGLVISGSGAPSAPAAEGFGVKVVDRSCTDNLVVATQFVGNRDGDVFEATPGLVERSATITR